MATSTWLLRSIFGAICLAIAGFTLWVLCDSAIKFAGQSQLPNYEIIAFLGVFIAMFIALYAVMRGEVRELWPKRPTRMVFRSSLDLGNNLFVVIALRHLPLTLLYILVFTSPMVVAILGRLFLGERLSWQKVGAILVGFAGVVTAVYPSRVNGSANWIGFAACGACVACFSIAIVWTRQIVQAERSESMTFFSGLVTGAAGHAGMLFYAVPVSGKVMVALLAMGLLCAVGNTCIFVALKYTTAATVSQYHYTQLLSGAIVTYLLFHELPTKWMIGGAALIVASGVFIALQSPGTDNPQLPQSAA